MYINLISIGITNKNTETLDDFRATITEILSRDQDGISFYVLPEYCWGKVSEETILENISIITQSLDDNQYVVFGSFPKTDGNEKYNTAILGGKNGAITEIQKTRVLSNEQKRNDVKPGQNSGVVQIEDIKVAIIICADIWDRKLLEEILGSQNADVLLVPAFTVVPPNYGGYAKSQWYSLALVRSREYLVPIAIADHSKSLDSYGVGGATCIVDPSRKSEDMISVEDFLDLPHNDIATRQVQFDKIDDYRQYRIDKGLFSEEIIK